MDAATVGLASAALEGLKFIYQIVRDGNLKKSERKKIESEAKKLVQLAQMSDIETELKKAKAGQQAHWVGVAYRAKKLSRPAAWPKKKPAPKKKK